MASFLESTHYDLVTPDGVITDLKRINDREAIATVFIEKINPLFVGYHIDSSHVSFNLKSTLAQVGLDGIGQEIRLDFKANTAEAIVKLIAIDRHGTTLLKLLDKGAIIGKLFAADERRRVRDPDYLARMFGRADRWGRPLLSLGGLHGSNDLILDKVDGRTVAYLSLQNGKVEYDESIYGFLPTLEKGLPYNMSMREMVKLHQEFKPDLPRNVDEGELLLVKTLPLHIRTVFGKVVDSFLSEGYKHTSANVLQPDTFASGDIYEFYGNSKREITDVPLEFYTLEPYREHVFFNDRDQLKRVLDEEVPLFEAFKTAPLPLEMKAAVFVVKSDQLLHLKPDEWVARETHFHEFPGQFQSSRQALQVERYIEQQPDYPFLKAIEDEKITSQGILLTRYFPSPLMKRMLLSDEVQRLLKRIYFQHASYTHQQFFSAEDRSLLHDLDKFAIPVYWVDEATNTILLYVQKPNQDSGLFVPVDHVEEFLKSTVFGIYGSNLMEGDFEKEIMTLMQGILDMRNTMTHPLLHVGTPVALVTGGGPGVMEVGNRVAKELGILSCANIVDFSNRSTAVVNEQKQNPFVEAKMTYRIDKLVERQAEFNLDFPIFLKGGIGTDFEYCLEEVRRKVGSQKAYPILLFGSVDYWTEKVTSRFRCNLKTGTIKGSEWISNCFYCVANAHEGLEIYRRYFENRLNIGKEGPVYDQGFCDVSQLQGQPQSR